ncbi:MAG: response regulator [Acidobacteria bacterium]|nr:response regulator [Acidobacteriota bacterium]MYG74963.1 response regulator [Acidobacteriota bacterium]
MNEHPDELRQQIEALQERVSRLSAAVLRMSASLDLDTVLQEAVDSARALTGARYGTIATVDETGRPEDFVTSGFTPGERQELANWPEGPRLFEHLRNLEAPLRIADLPAYVRTLGLSSDLIRSKTLQGAPMLHRGVHVGNFFLAEKESGGEFTSADEEVLMLFAAQAAIAIANARTHRDEQRARSDLETLIETSPVGVVVLDARTGRLVWVNREARRITEPLRTPDTTLEGLLKGLIARRADGREIVFAEFPIVREIGAGETVRAEEFTFSVSSGRSISALVNATPIRTADGEVESYVATMQDLAPLKEAERQRTEFLSLVSHELRAPLISIKGSTATVLGAAPAPDPAEMLQFFRVIDERANHMRGLIADLLDQGRIETGTLSVSPELAEVARLVDQARNTFVSGGGRHTLRIDLPEDLPRVLVDRGRIVQVLNNLLANAARHSPESSAIGVTATHDGVHVAISVSDEGRGVAPDRLPHLFRKRARGGDEDRGFGANGLGLVICKGLVEAHGGRIWAESGGLGRGSQFIFTVPVAEESGRGAVAAVPSRSRPSRDVHAQTRILVVDDDPQTLRYVRDALTEAGYAVFVTGDPEALPDLIRSHQPSLVLLDVVLPGTDGIELMESVPELADLPVIFISVYGRDETIVRALDAGAADYLVKPFSPSELTARVRAALRVRAEPAPFLLDELSIDYDMRRVEVAGAAVELTATEYQLLRVLSMNAGRVLTFDSLLRQAWRGRKSAGDPKLVRAVVKRLRRKLGDDAANPTYVRNERGVGYRMPKPDDG